MFEEQVHRREVSKTGGVLERRVTGPIVRTDQVGTGSDQLSDGFGIAGAGGRNECRELWIDGLRRSVILDLDTEVGALVDPGAEDSDLLIWERTSGRHLQAAVAVDEPTDKFAFGAVARDDDRAIIAAPQSVLPLVEAEAGLLGVFAVTGVALLGEDRLDVLFEVDFSVRGWWELGLTERQGQHDKEKCTAHCSLLQ